MATCVPEHPQFASDAEESVWRTLKAKLRDVDVLMHGVRLSDGLYGDVEIDLLVLMPDCGAAVIEVKGGHVSHAAGRWTSSGSHGVVSIHPIDQARNGMHSLRRFVEHQPSWSRGPLRAMWFVAFPYTLVDGDMGPEGRRDLVIDEADLPDAAGRIYDHLLGSTSQTPLPARGWVGALVDLLLGSPNPRRGAAGRTAPRLRHVESLTAEQSALLSVVRHNRLLEITGSAGTGKTWLAMEQAQRWAAAGMRVAFVTCGRGNAQMVKSALGDVVHKSQPAFVGTFQQLGFTWGVDPPPDPDDDLSAWDGTGQMLRAAQMLSDVEGFDAFVVDQAQDFADGWWPALLAAARNASTYRLAVFRDDQHSVHPGRAGRPDLPMVQLALDKNLRNSRPIVDTLRPLLRSPIDPIGGEGFPVEFVNVHEVDGDIYAAASDIAVTMLDDRGWLPEQVALLTTQHRHPVHSELAADRAGYWDLLWSSDDVFYSTVIGFSGLDRPAVVLAVDGFHPDVDPRALMYAGMSRARDQLVIVADPDQLTPIVGEKMMRRLTRSHYP